MLYRLDVLLLASMVKFVGSLLPLFSRLRMLVSFGANCRETVITADLLSNEPIVFFSPVQALRRCGVLAPWSWMLIWHEVETI
jgi:hypothetical protein